MLPTKTGATNGSSRNDSWSLVRSGAGADRLSRAACGTRRPDWATRPGSALLGDQENLRRATAASPIQWDAWNGCEPGRGLKATT